MIKTKRPATRNLTASLVWYPVAILPAPCWVSIGSCSIRCRLRIKKTWGICSAGSAGHLYRVQKALLLMISYEFSVKFRKVNLFGSELKIFWVVSTPTVPLKTGLANGSATTGAVNLPTSLPRVHKSTSKESRFPHQSAVGPPIPSATLRSSASLAAKVRSCRRHFGLDDFGFVTIWHLKISSLNPLKSYRYPTVLWSFCLMSSCCPDLEMLRSLFLLEVRDSSKLRWSFSGIRVTPWKYEAWKKVLNVHTALSCGQEVQLISLDNSGRISTCDHHVVFDKHHNLITSDFKTPHINAIHCHRPNGLNSLNLSKSEPRPTFAASWRLTHAFCTPYTWREHSEVDKHLEVLCEWTQDNTGLWIHMKVRTRSIPFVSKSKR